MSDHIAFNTAYHHAAKHSILTVLKDASEQDLNLRDDNGRTPLHYASLKGHLNAIKIILSGGGKIDKCDYFGNSALHYAVRSRSLKCVSFLLNYEPKLIWMMDINNLTARQLCETLEYPEVSRVLDEFYNKQMKMKSSQLHKFQMREMSEAQKRREKYEKLMKNANKTMLDEYKRRKLHRFEFGSRTYLAYDKIVVDENITLISSLGKPSKASSTSMSNLITYY